MKWVAIGLAAIIAVAVGAWWYEYHRAESALLKQPIYRVLKEHERALYDELVEEYRVLPARRGESGEIREPQRTRRSTWRPPSGWHTPPENPCWR